MMRSFGIGLFLLAATVSAQDVHFSQFPYAPFTVDPALTGDIPTDQRATLIYRDQWSSVGSPFRTYAAGYDLPLLKRRLGGRYLGLGLSAYRDRAGKSEFGDTRADLGIAYGLRAGGRSNIAFGLQAGYGQRSAMLNELRWDSQFNGSGYDPTLPANEAVADASVSFFDMAAGGAWTMALKSGLEWTLGGAAFHLLEPQVSLYGTSHDRLYRRYVVHGEVHWTAGRWEWMPRIYGSQQGGAREVLFGTMVERRLGTDSRYTKNLTSNAVQFGCFYRWGDAVVPSVQFEYHRMLRAMVSYDVNISRLHKRSSYQGGFEVGLQWIGAFKEQRVGLPGHKSGK
ncbi:MAG: PorP/SprF family type IX secretion system membrane protein [Flavobacteriales bacterium]|nr:PorP/SprF family type IX secretion system membrane protein [Flavobacteriales bacterium]MCB9166931.1 PorP/SprF family type IX secretion system membrane protein [Flavobacteriales bacterium]